MDKYSKEKRSEIMSKVSSKNTSLEITIRKMLHRLNYRFRLHRKDLPGKPDIVLPKYKKLYLSMVVSGMGMKIVKKEDYLNLIANIGKIKL
ncbi:hypothetical protein PAE9249_03209 [Paenibacillus sp. CECT 9249]|uniref:very short patch repair endonuclease n=1 Tax=Paenibacillus sp. CECT 9249 TaxID=2845385 RepID=UPI001E382BF3|nr:very short patch repair endonuclease [Paenibacillus sp. CECT 9249]CAH0120688.1 hypothetical protein PAE9249_03209 [Paenibacillus sp. CECT 9249]